MSLPPADQRIEVLYVWIAIHANGSEGIMSGNMSGRHLPLLTSREALIPNVSMLAEQVRQDAAAAGNPITVEIRQFVRSPVEVS